MRRLGVMAVIVGMMGFILSQSGWAGDKKVAEKEAVEMKEIVVTATGNCASDLEAYQKLIVKQKSQEGMPRTSSR